MGLEIHDSHMSRARKDIIILSYMTQGRTYEVNSFGKQPFTCSMKFGNYMTRSNSVIGRTEHLNTCTAVQ